MSLRIKGKGSKPNPPKQQKCWREKGKTRIAPKFVV